MRTVFAVSSGSYSDYGVIAIFGTRAQAQAYIDQAEVSRYSDPCFIEEFAFAPEGEEIKSRRYYVVRLKNGVEHQRYSEESLKPLVSTAWRYSGGTWAYGYSTRSYAVAEKAARDKLTALELEEAGL